MDVINTVLVDDHPLIRGGIKDFFSRTENINVIGESDNGLIAQKVISSLSPRVVLVDIEMPEMGGIEFTSWAKSNHPDIKIVILSTYDDEAYVLSTLKAGADGYVLKNSSPATLVHVINEVNMDKTALDPAVTRCVVSFANEPKVIESNLDRPSKREIQILKLVAEGKKNKEIGNHLCISSRTVQGHLRNLFSKLKVCSRTEAVSKALSENILSADDFKTR